MNSDLQYKFVTPDKNIQDFVEGFWILKNTSDKPKEVLILPDGRIDLFLSSSNEINFRIMIVGLETKPKSIMIPPHSLDFVVSFKLLAVEYVFHNTIKEILNKAQNLPDNFWGFCIEDLADFEKFCRKVTAIISANIVKPLDSRKQKLFEILHKTEGALTVKEFSENTFWSSRQINNYFNKRFGISLKTYCNILRFRSSFSEINNGIFYPGSNFSDQSHFSREIKRFSGVSPKELGKNKNDRFIQFFTLNMK